MDKILFNTYKIEERSQVSYIKRIIHNLVRPVFDETRTGEIDIIISELCSNIVKHAGGGELLYRLQEEPDHESFELLCIDNGPGMKDVLHSSKDGISTKNTLGQGMGAVSRLSTISQVYSLPGWGTIAYVKVFKAPHVPKPSKFIYCCLNVALPGQEVSGDGMSATKYEHNKFTLFAGDGLGHGRHAAEAVDAASASFKKNKSIDPSEILRGMHEDVKKTRGLVGSVISLDADKGSLLVCGIGNIHVRIQKGIEYKNYLSHNGIIGLNIPQRLQNTVLKLEKFQMIILCSDGIRTAWDLIRYPAISKYDPLVIAAALYKDHARRTDDMTITILKVI